MPANCQIKTEHKSVKSLTNPLDHRPKSIFAQMQFFTSFIQNWQSESSSFDTNDPMTQWPDDPVIILAQA